LHGIKIIFLQVNFQYHIAFCPVWHIKKHSIKKVFIPPKNARIAIRHEKGIFTTFGLEYYE